MTGKRGSTRNFNDVADVKAAIPVPFGANSPILLAAANDARMSFEVDILPKFTDVSIFIRLYPVAQDNLQRGYWIGRFNMANDTFFRPFWKMPDGNVYTGEISAIMVPGPIADENVYVTEVSDE